VQPVTRIQQGHTRRAQAGDASGPGGLRHQQQALMRAAPCHGFKPWTQTELSEFSAGHRQKRWLRSIPRQPGWSLRHNQRLRAGRGIRRVMAGPKRPRLIGAGILFNEEMEFDGWSKFRCHHFPNLLRRFSCDFCSSERARFYVFIS